MSVHPNSLFNKKIAENDSRSNLFFYRIFSCFKHPILLIFAPNFWYSWLVITNIICHYPLWIVFVTEF